MTKLLGAFRRFRKDENGATMIEYSILIGIITALVIASITTMGTRVQGWWTTLVTNTTPAG